MTTSQSGPRPGDGRRSGVTAAAGDFGRHAVVETLPLPDDGSGVADPNEASGDSPLECIGAELSWDGICVTVRWHQGGHVRLPTEWCTGAEVRRLDDTDAAQFTIRFHPTQPVADPSVQGMLALRLHVRLEYIHLAHELAHLLTVGTRQQRADPDQGAPAVAIRTAPDDEHWITFRPTPVTEELLADVGRVGRRHTDSTP